MRLRQTLLAVLILIFTGASAVLRAQGGPPFLTDDPGTPGNRHWEVNFAWTHEHRHGENASELPLLDINYGWGDRIQLKYEVPYLIIHEAESTRQNGLGNSEAGVKWRFYDDEKSGLTLSTYPQVEFRNPGSNSAARGLVADESVWILPLEFQREANGWGINAEIGALLPSKSASAWTYGVVVGHELNDRLELGVELHGEGLRTLKQTELAALVGLRWKVNEHVFLLTSIGRELHNHFEERASLLTYLAVQWLR